MVGVCAMVKRFYSSSLLNAYSQVKSKRSFLFSLLVLLVIFLVILFVFFSGEKSVKELTQTADSDQMMEMDLMDNLQWLNHQPLLRAQMPAQADTLKPALEPKPVPLAIDSKRMQGTSMVYAKTIATSERQLDRVEPVAGERRLLAGEVLHAVLESAIQSDFAGPVRAILSEPAYSYSGMHVVLPAGTRIIGEYQNSIKAAQVRVGIEWKRMILPDGSSIDFSAPATDPIGRVGIEATRIDTHFWKRFGEAGLYSLLSAGSQLSGGLSADTLTAGQLLRSQISTSFADTAMADLEKDKSIEPTIYLDPGAEISIFVRRDMEF